MAKEGGQVTAHCLWTACKALGGGTFLILVGAAMATVGFYADELSVVAQVVDGNRTLHSPDKTLNQHLANLSYVGPLIMGVGGFVIVATCVMTFEARDNAAKVVPARFRKPIVQVVPLELAIDKEKRREITATFIEFSQKLQKNIASGTCPLLSGEEPKRLLKCPSAPNLAVETISAKFQLTPTSVDTRFLYVPGAPVGKRAMFAGLPRQAKSMDAPRPPPMTEDVSPIKQKQPVVLNVPKLKKSDSTTSMALDLYLPDCPITLRVEDESRPALPSTPSRKPSTNERRQQLRRQRQVERTDSDEENS